MNSSWREINRFSSRLKDTFLLNPRRLPMDKLELLSAKLTKVFAVTIFWAFQHNLNPAALVFHALWKISSILLMSVIQIMLFSGQDFGDSSFYWKQYIVMEGSWVGVIKTWGQVLSLPLGICVNQDTLLCVSDRQWTIGDGQSEVKWGSYSACHRGQRWLDCEVFMGALWFPFTCTFSQDNDA